MDCDIKYASETFFKIQQYINNLNKIDPSSPENQKDIKEKIKELEKVVYIVSSHDLFSRNEILKEISSDNLKFILLPAFMGYLNNFILEDRKSQINIVLEYYIDFLKRCENYHFYTSEDGENEHKMLLTQEQTREEKIQNYKMQKKFDSELENLKGCIYNSLKNHKLDDLEILKQKHSIALINKYIYIIKNDLKLLQKEQDILNFAETSTEKPNIQCDSRPIYIDSNLLIGKTMSNKVFGKGYPSVATLTPQEWYEEKTKRERIENEKLAKMVPSPRVSNQSQSSDIEEDSDDKLKEQRQLDDWKDTHRTGWGNTYNKG